MDNYHYKQTNNIYVRPKEQKIIERSIFMIEKMLDLHEWLVR